MGDSEDEMGSEFEGFEEVADIDAENITEYGTVQKIRQNLFWAFVFNAAGIPLAASGWLTPVLAGMAMSMSSLSVMLNALLLRRHRAPH
jgi:hypothetical protein